MPPIAEGLRSCCNFFFKKKNSDQRLLAWQKWNIYRINNGPQLLSGLKGTIGIAILLDFCLPNKAQPDLIRAASRRVVECRWKLLPGGQAGTSPSRRRRRLTQETRNGKTPHAIDAFVATWSVLHPNLLRQTNTFTCDLNLSIIQQYFSLIINQLLCYDLSTKRSKMACMYASTSRRRRDVDTARWPTWISVVYAVKSTRQN